VEAGLRRRKIPGSGFAGRPEKRTIAARFGFLILFGLRFGIPTPHPHSA
jgi:hypothetical protein